MQELVKYRGMYTGMAELLKSGTPGPDLHAHHDLLASALPQGSGGQVPLPDCNTLHLKHHDCKKNLWVLLPLPGPAVRCTSDP